MATARVLLSFCVTGAKMKEAFFVLLEGAGSGERCVLSSQAENAKLLEVSATQGLLCHFPRQDPPAFLGKPLRMSLHSAGTRCWDSPHEAYGAGWVEDSSDLRSPWRWLLPRCQAWASTGPLQVRHSGLITHQLWARLSLWMTHLEVQLVPQSW